MMAAFVIAALADPLLEAVKKEPFVSGYLLCSYKEAGELERSGESAESIAVVVLAACDGLIDFPVRMKIEEADAKLRASGKAPLSDAEREQAKSALKEKLQEGARTVAISRVVNMRAR